MGDLPSNVDVRLEAISERLARMMPAVKDTLPEGDFREWDVIDAWAREIAEGIAVPVAVG
jgi:menaquinone-dependent protoporphyrinogen oxidase